MKIYPIGSVVTHKGKPEFGYGIIVDSFESEEEQMNEEIFAMILWHGDENIELRETPQLDSLVGLLMKIYGAKM